MPKADNRLYLFGEYMVLTDNSDESVQNAEKTMQDRAVQFMKDKGVLQIITHRDSFNPGFFEVEPTLKPATSVGWKLNMNPLLKEPDLSDQPIKPLSMVLNELGCELRKSVDAVFQRSRKHTITISEMYDNTVDAINDVISKTITMNQGREVR